MQRIKIGDDDQTLSRMVYGVWRLADDQDTSISHVREKIDACLEQGITTFDHADIYGEYECEKLFGKALEASPKLRETIEIVTKCDIALVSSKYPTHRVKHYDTSPEYIIKSVDNSLKHLHTDYLDSLLIHRPDPFMNAELTGGVLDDLVKSGKVRTVGVSNFSVWEWKLLQANMKTKLAINQIEMSLLAQTSFWDGTLAAMQLDNLTPMAWSPLAGGQLFDSAHTNPALDQLLTRIERENGATRDQVAFAWLLAHPANILPVIGTNNLDRIRATSHALNINIDRQTWFELMEASSGNEVP